MAWQCPACRDYVENGRIACTGCGTTRGGTVVAERTERAERERERAPLEEGRRDLAMEAHLAATALWYRVAGVLGGGLLVVGWLLGHIQGYGAPLSSLLVGGGVCALLVLLGAGLGRLSTGARLVAGLLSLVGLGGTVLNLFRGHHHGPWLSVGLSIAWSFAYLWLFFSDRARAVTQPAYRRLVAQDLGTKPRIWTSPFFWMPLIAFGLTVLAIVWFFGAVAAMSFHA